jgi:hypothetical protein
LKPFLKINNVEFLLKNLKVKLKKNEDSMKIPKPELVLKQLRKNCELNTITGYKNVLLLMKYFIIYIYEINDDSCYSTNTNHNVGNNQAKFASIFATQIIGGIKSDDSYKVFSDWEYRDDAKIIIESDVYILIILYMINISIDRKQHMEIFYFE